MQKHLAILCILLMGVAVACGDGGEPPSPSPTKTPVASPSPGTPTPGPPTPETPVSATPSPIPTPDLSQPSIGKVEDVVARALLDDNEASKNDQIYVRSVIETNDTGLAAFHTDDVAACDTRANSWLQIRPDDKVAIKWLGTTGMSYCITQKGEWNTYSVGDTIEIVTEDPIFGVVFVENGTVIKLVQGSAYVTVIGWGREELTTGEELFVPVEGMPVKRSLELSPEERAIVDRLQELAAPADLVAQFDDLASDPEQDTCTIEYTVRNEGGGAAGPSLTRVMLGYEEFKDEPTPALDVGESVSLSTTLPSACPFDPDLHGGLTVDVDDRVAESNEENNTTPIQELRAPADLVAWLDDYASDPEQDTCTIWYTVSNDGRGAAGPSLTRVTVNGLSKDEPTPALDGGDFVSLSTILPSACPFHPDLHGTLVVDVDDRVAESNEENNTTPIDIIG